MLKSIELVNVRRHVHTQVELGQLTVLAGPNGSGKTTLLDAVELMTRGGTDSHHWQEFWKRAGATGSSITIDEDGVAVARGWSDDDALLHLHEDARDRLHSTRVLTLKLDPAKMRMPCALKEVRAFQSDGGNLAAMLADMILARDGRIESVDHALHAVVPGALRIRSDRIGDRAQLSVEFAGVGPLRGDQLSEGTLIAIGLLTALQDVTGPTVLLIDDVDRGLHMDAQIELIGILKRAVESTPDLQIILTTHSPFIMEGVDARDIVLFGLDDGGATVAGKLTEHPDAERLLRILSPAEMWTSVAEGWLKEKTEKKAG